MARRSSYISVEKIGMARPAHVSGMSDRLYRVFQCLNPECVNIITVQNREIGSDFRIACSVCKYELHSGGKHLLFDYRVIDLRTNQTYVDEISGEAVEDTPEFISHDDYLQRSARWKYCLLCNTMKPLTEFDIHNSRKETGRQGECNSCKVGYNAVKNGTRLIEQHREASQQRRLMIMLGETVRLDKDAIVSRFGGRCFKCNELVKPNASAGDPLKANWDHTRPAAFLWPMRTEDATLLCREHNGDKSDTWPGGYYSEAECRRLSRLTGIDYSDLVGPPRYNPDALERLKNAEFVETLFERFARYPEVIVKLRNRLVAAEGFDFFESTRSISGTWRDRADALLKV